MEKFFYHLSITSFYGLMEVSVLITNTTLFRKYSDNKKDLKHSLKARKTVFGQKVR